jgi:hypothetical protein
MIIKGRVILSSKIVILSLPFIFGIIAQAWADSIKSINNAANQETIMKKKGLAKGPIRSSKNRNIRFYKGISYSDYGAIIGDIRPDVNFLKTLEEKKNPRLRDSLDKVIYSYEFFKDAWKDKFLTFRGIAEAKSSNSGSDQSVPKPYPNGNKYFEEGRILTTFKLLQSKREELLKEVSMGFRFSFEPMSGHMFLEMNVTPASETGTGIIIPF